MYPSLIIRSSAARRGLTLVEATIAMLIVAGLLVAALTAVGATARARVVQASAGKGHARAQALLEEALGTRYAEPGGAAELGPDPGDGGGNRKKFDDVDDYHGWSSNEARDKNNELVPGMTGWQEAVTVVYADPDNPADDAASDLGLKRVTVTVTDPRGRATSVSALRGRESLYETAPSPVTARLHWVGLAVQVGDDPATTVSTGLAVLNRPAEP